VERLRDRPGCPIMSLVPAMKQAAATTGAGGGEGSAPTLTSLRGLLSSPCFHTWPILLAKLPTRFRALPSST